MRQYAQVRTVKDALMTKTPHIGNLVKVYGEKVTEAYIKVWLINLNSALNLRRPLEEHQIDECAFLIISEYRNISVADITLIFKNAKLGKYGELYESLSIDKILRWFKDYFDSRCNTAGELSRQEAEKHKYQEEKGERSSRNSEWQKMKDVWHEYKLEKLKNLGNEKDKS